MFKHQFKKRLSSSAFLLKILNSISDTFPRVFVYHRFTPVGVSVPHRVSADAFGWQLDQIKKYGDVITFGECLKYYQDKNAWPKRCVVITIDDGYSDFYQYAFPELKKRKIRATLFPTVNFVEGKIWLWPDRLEFAIQKTVSKTLSIFLDGVERQFSISNEGQKGQVLKTLTDYCKTLADNIKEKVLVEVEGALGVPRIQQPPIEYSATTWEGLKEMQDSCIEIGSHTMNHPILSKVDSDQLVDEIFKSKKILEEKLGKTIVSFCYPNSDINDINSTVLNAVACAGYLGAVFGVDLSKWDRFMIPRMGLTEDPVDFLWKLNGGEGLLSNIKNKFYGSEIL